MCVCVCAYVITGRGLANVSSTKGEVCTVYTLHTVEKLPPVFYYKHGILRGFMVYTANIGWLTDGVLKLLLE